MKYKLFCAVLCLLVSTQAVVACSGRLTLQYPSCRITTPYSGEVVTVVSVHKSVTNERSTHHLGDDETATRIVNLHVAESKTKNFLILEAQKQTIWRFTGDVDSVSKVIVLGATDLGPLAAGVMGLPISVVEYTVPDMSLFKNSGQMSCQIRRRSCTIGQWFKPIENVRGPIEFSPKPWQAGFSADFVVGTTVYGIRYGGPITIVGASDIETVTPIDPNEVVSVSKPKPYEVMPR